jgi:hypothetical protein
MNARDIIRAIAEKHGITLHAIMGTRQGGQPPKAVSRARWEAFATLADHGYSQAQTSLVMNIHVDTVRRCIKLYRERHEEIEAVRLKKMGCKEAQTPINDNEFISERVDLERRSDELLRLIAVDLRRLVA